jgi:hypothetical protein
MKKERYIDRRKYTTCAWCGKALGEEYLVWRSNHPQRDWFDYDNIDNAFCAEECAGEALMLETIDNTWDEDKR